MDAYINPKEDETTRDDEWEKKIITAEELANFEYVTTFSEKGSDVMRAALINKYREWLLGGKNCDWKYQINKITGDITLWRR